MRLIEAFILEKMCNLYTKTKRLDNGTLDTCFILQYLSISLVAGADYDYRDIVTQVVRCTVRCSTG